MPMTTKRSRRRLVGTSLVTLAMLVAACGDDDDDAIDAGDTTITSVPETGADTTAPTADTTAPTDTAPAGDTTAPGAEGDGEETPPSLAPVTGEFAEVCTLAQEIFLQEDFPTAEQLTRYQELAPDEIADAVETAAPPLIAADGDLVAFFNAFADDEVTEAIDDEINPWEEENCGIPHSENVTPTPEGVTDEIEDDANLVEISSTEYSFDVPATLEAGRTSFVLTNNGAQAHFMGIGKLVEGVTLEDALASEDGSGTEAEWDSGLAAAGGEDEEVLTFDLEPGNYGMVCFIPDADGTPHAFKGMAIPFTVT